MTNDVSMMKNESDEGDKSEKLTMKEMQVRNEFGVFVGSSF